MKRMVEVAFRLNGTDVVERYGPFENNQHLAAWLDEQDHHARFGNHFRMELQLLGSVSVPVPAVKRTTTKRTAKR